MITRFITSWHKQQENNWCNPDYYCEDNRETRPASPWPVFRRPRFQIAGIFPPDNQRKYGYCHDSD
jgi:hypothetical protein